ncbi:c-type cytochrome [Psychroserpens sp.]|uniref:c-type cytochrome n=1 Tax=Psychroserpens sp. TaxID=2020870 RepID=UPI001B064B35|nr:c-type cytochrome [Psychroserpens sp.]MBO6607819.1 c-type cytochrome [Psychroserpens sp.]MBO6654810.1 c-type cytochrome [Psychroserpens sp.]MBO6682766.1 c-type cytochrome [Psychroserpens sp.]MBO6751177.1 c-type cytochrome [Psychroserpens sp.]MBO6916254.1 c-type cytochrome [Psychroserpens sp.]
MIQVIYRRLASKMSSLGLVILLTLSTSLNAQEGDPVKGKQLYNTNCAACHQLDRKMTGPALRNVEARLAEEQGLDREWLNSWIRNSAGMIKSGDAYANQIWNEYNQTAMTAFPTLSDQDISDILAYTAATPPEKDDEVIQQQVVVQEPGISNKLILGALAILFALLAMALVLVRRTLNRFAEEKGLETIEEDKGLPIWKAFVQNQFLVLCSVIFLMLASAYFVYGYFMQVGVDQGYEPVQPIHYSHRIHAGDNGIDCKYCHSSARVSKHSGIPSLNICMNCHKSIYQVAEETQKEGIEEYGIDYNAEIQKLYKAVGWDENEQKYTGETQPVKWVRIHNLPDFAYFNHSQHVSVAGVECQTCHGPVEEMEIMYQHSSLTMGWCINCHRETNVKVEDNAYYAKIHEQLSKKYGVEKLTAAQMGGLECGKCHY